MHKIYRRHDGPAYVYFILFHFLTTKHISFISVPHTNIDIFHISRMPIKMTFFAARGAYVRQNAFIASPFILYAFSAAALRYFLGYIAQAAPFSRCARCRAISGAADLYFIIATPRILLSSPAFEWCFSIFRDAPDLIVCMVWLTASIEITPSGLCHIFSMTRLRIYFQPRLLILLESASIFDTPYHGL